MIGLRIDKTFSNAVLHPERNLRCPHINQSVEFYRESRVQQATREFDVRLHS